MEYTEYRVKFKSRKDRFRLYPLGDVHSGTIHTAEGEIRRQVKLITEDPFALWIGMGDYADLITPHSPHWDVKVVAPWVEASNIAESQRKWIVNLFRPIADKCVGLLCGNHEDNIRRHNCQDIYLDICRDLGVPILGTSSFVRFFFGRKKSRDVHSFLGVFHHGHGAAQTEGGKVMTLKKFIDSHQADIYAIGHLHCIKVEAMPQLACDSGGRIHDIKRVGAITGSWFRSYTQGVAASYAEKKMYPPTEIGCPHFIIEPDKHRLEVMGANV